MTFAVGKAIHPNTLTNTIRWLRDQRYIEHRQGHDTAEYALTVRGRQLVRLIEEVNRSDQRLNGDAGDTTETDTAEPA